ncbi:MAG: hypothetical protein CMA06_02320, partial [Euryarchaeota archaeon]|nr:hypothetical protein [Euryarchaeota archaeon]
MHAIETTRGGTRAMWLLVVAAATAIRLEPPRFTQQPDVWFRAADFDGTWTASVGGRERPTATITGNAQRVSIADDEMGFLNTGNPHPDTSPTQGANAVDGVYGDQDTTITLLTGLPSNATVAMTLCSVTKWATPFRYGRKTVLSAGAAHPDMYQGHWAGPNKRLYVGATRWGTQALHPSGSLQTDARGMPVRPFKVAADAGQPYLTERANDWVVVCASNGSPYAFVNGVEHGVPHGYDDASSLVGVAWPEIGLNTHSANAADRSEFVVADVVYWSCTMGYTELQQNSAALMARTLGFENMGGLHQHGDAVAYDDGKWMPTALGLQNLMRIGMHDRPFTVETANSGWQARTGGAGADYTVPRLHSDLSESDTRALFDDEVGTVAATSGSGSKYVQIEWATGAPVAGTAHRAMVSMVRIHWGRSYATDFDVKACSPGTTPASACEFEANWRVVARVRSLDRTTYEDARCVCNLPYPEASYYGACANGACNDLGVCTSASLGLVPQAGPDTFTTTPGLERFSDAPGGYTEHALLEATTPWAMLRLEFHGNGRTRYSAPSPYGGGCAPMSVTAFELTEIEVVGTPVASWADACGPYVGKERRPGDVVSASTLDGPTGFHVFDYTRQKLYPIQASGGDYVVRFDTPYAGCPP